MTDDQQLPERTFDPATGGPLPPLPESAYAADAEPLAVSVGGIVTDEGGRPIVDDGGRPVVRGGYLPDATSDEVEDEDDDEEGEQ